MLALVIIGTVVVFLLVQWQRGRLFRHVTDGAQAMRVPAATGAAPMQTAPMVAVTAVVGMAAVATERIGSVPQRRACDGGNRDRERCD